MRFPIKGSHATGLTARHGATRQVPVTGTHVCLWPAPPDLSRLDCQPLWLCNRSEIGVIRSPGHVIIPTLAAAAAGTVSLASHRGNKNTKGVRCPANCPGPGLVGYGGVARWEVKHGSIHRTHGPTTCPPSHTIPAVHIPVEG